MQQTTTSEPTSLTPGYVEAGGKFKLTKALRLSDLPSQRNIPPALPPFTVTRKIAKHPLRQLIQEPQLTVLHNVATQFLATPYGM